MVKTDRKEERKEGVMEIRKENSKAKLFRYTP
jgi:hypothetical protein